VSPTEANEIVNAFADKSDIKAVQANGVHVAGERFVVLKADDRSLYGRKVDDSNLPL
jgi:profilin